MIETPMNIQGLLGMLTPMEIPMEMEAAQVLVREVPLLMFL